MHLMRLTDLRAAKILIMHQGAVGDFILILPTLKALRDSLRPIRMEIMAQPWNLPLVDGRFYADRVWDVNMTEMAPFFHEAAPLPECMCRYFSSFDATLIFGTSQILASNVRRAGTENVCLLPPFPDGPIHLVDHHLSSLSDLGISIASAEPTVYLREEDIDRAGRFLHSIGCGTNGSLGIAAVHPGAGSPKKAWPSRRFAAVGRELVQAGLHLLIVQGPADKEIVSEMRQHLNGLLPTVVRDRSLLELAAILSRCSLYIGNDSGVSHLAAAVGIPTIVIFGPTDPLVWAPRAKKTFLLQSTTPCSPCNLDLRQRCKQQRCLENVHLKDMRDVLAEIKISRDRVLASGACSPPVSDPTTLAVGTIQYS